ncbi:MAG: quaternary ammonium compound efflux SMR transporter SugE [Victivallaceae bacterium]|nr:quaternary ammonium compound efflux SMR transporter SugE [Victivallaceae bacterium]
MNWIFLLLAGLCEISWAVGMKYSHGFTRLLPSAFTAIMMILSVVGLSLALRTLPLGTAYAVWTGIGAVGTAIFGIVVFGDSASALRILCLGLIVAGIVGLKLVSGESGS